MSHHTSTTQRVTTVILLALLHQIMILNRDAPVIILNEATQCYFNAGLQCLFATKNFIPWITSLPNACIEENKKNSALIEELSKLSTTYAITSFDKWPTNKGLFQILQKAASIQASEQYDVLTMMNMILDRLPTAKNCNNPFIIQGNIRDTTGEQLNNVSIYELRIGLQRTTKMNPEPSITTAFNENFPTLNITHYPTILCLGISIENPEAKIPIKISLTQNKLTENSTEGRQYKLTGVAWRVGESAASGHYFATVTYNQKWYIVDDIIRYGGPMQHDGMPKEYSITDPIPIEGLLVPEKANNNYTWLYKSRTKKELSTWLKAGRFQYEDPLSKEKTLVSPVFIVYEYESHQPIYKGKESDVLQQHLATLQNNLQSLAQSIKS